MAKRGRPKGSKNNPKSFKDRYWEFEILDYFWGGIVPVTALIFFVPYILFTSNSLMLSEKILFSIMLFGYWLLKSVLFILIVFFKGLFIIMREGSK